jgi:hypothetical protein
LEDGKLRVEELGAQHRHQTLAEFMVDVVFEEDEGNAEDVAATEASAEPAAQAEAKREQEPRAEAETPAAADAAEAHATATPRAVAAAADALRAAEADADEKEKEEEEEGDVTFGVHELEAPAVGAPLPSEEEIMQEEERYREARESLIEDPFYVCDLSVVARKHRCATSARSDRGADADSRLARAESGSRCSPQSRHTMPSSATRTPAS